MKKWVCSVLASFCLALPLYGYSASLEEIARPMHEVSSKHWVPANPQYSTYFVNTKLIHYDKATKRLSFWSKEINKEELTNPQIKRCGAISKVIVDMPTVSYAYEYSDGWSVKEDKILAPSTTPIDKLRFEPILPDDYLMEDQVNMVFELAGLPGIHKPHSYTLVAQKECPIEELPDRVKSRVISMYLCNDFYVKDVSPDTWRFYIKVEYLNEFKNGKRNQYVWGTSPVYVNFKEGSIQFEYPDGTHKVSEPGYSKDVYDGICNLLKSKSDMPSED